MSLETFLACSAIVAIAGTYIVAVTVTILLWRDAKKEEKDE